MSETIKTLLAQELEKLEPQQRDDLEKQGIGIAVERELNVLAIRIPVPKKGLITYREGKEVYSGLELDLDSPIIGESVLKDVRRYIAIAIKNKLEGSK